jgi:hypothetical protein
VSSIVNWQDFCSTILEMAHRLSPVLLVLVTLLACVHCGINPVPEPPSGEPIAPPAIDNITVYPFQIMTEGNISIHAGPNTAEPGSTLWAMNIDGTGPAVTTKVHDDGSFALEITAGSGDEVRLQVRSGQQRSKPIDVIIPSEEGPPTLAVRPLAGCLSLEPAFELELPPPAGSQPPSASILIKNRCSSDVLFSNIHLRVPSEAFAVLPSELTIAPGNTAEVVVQVFGDAPREEILLLETQAPELDRRPITLFGQGGIHGLLPNCSLVGGRCLSDPMDVTFPANCEALGMKYLEATCQAMNLSCCGDAP